MTITTITPAPDYSPQAAEHVETVERVAPVIPIAEPHGWWSEIPAMRSFMRRAVAEMLRIYGHSFAITSPEAGRILPRFIAATGLHENPELFAHVLVARVMGGRTDQQIARTHIEAMTAPRPVSPGD